MSATLKKFWIEFIELYKSLPELWKQESEEYSNRNLRKNAYNLLLAKYQEVDKDATMFAVKKKINNLRTSFRREYVKVRRSRNAATNPEEVYRPTLWYYDTMDFLIDEEDDCDDEDHHSTAAIEEVYMGEECKPQNRQQVSSSPKLLQVSKTNPSQPPPKKIKFSNVPHVNNVQRRQQQHIRTDPAIALSIAWEALYEDLEHEQKLYANRMINEILYQAALGKLQENSYKLLGMTVDDIQEVSVDSTGSESEFKYYITDSADDEPIVVKRTVPPKRLKNAKNTNYNLHLNLE
ncbi:uncharacterized protein LOC142234968 [Haematobia irritans]|uniref:uncharacterized protein LOC142234968 n=1 Tax=Haematobia irritans TaxID=7368 RepID=UPI003F4FBDB1